MCHTSCFYNIWLLWLTKKSKSVYSGREEDVHEEVHVALEGVPPALLLPQPAKIHQDKLLGGLLDGVPVELVAGDGELDHVLPVEDLAHPLLGPRLELLHQVHVGQLQEGGQVGVEDGLVHLVGVDVPDELPA